MTECIDISKVQSETGQYCSVYSVQFSDWTISNGCIINELWTINDESRRNEDWIKYEWWINEELMKNK